MIPFNKPTHVGDESQFAHLALCSDKISGDGQFSRKCQQWFEDTLPCQKALLTTSCTHALEMAAMLAEIQEGDEVIMPSFTFVSTANAFVLRGARIVFVDIRPDTQNIDETLIEAAITNRTKAICVVHYAGVSCEMDVIGEIARIHNLVLIEDAAQGMMSLYKGRALGTMGATGAYSFHETKNYTSAGEGGLLIVNSCELKERSEILREKGTNRSQYFRGMTDKYTWVDIGSSYLMNDVSAACLWAQIARAQTINLRRLSIFNTYMDAFSGIAASEKVQLPVIPDDCTNNGHMFYLKLNNLEQRSRYISYMSKRDIMTVFHYVPLHSSTAGKRFGRFSGEDRNTTLTSETLVRLPIFYNLQDEDVERVINCTTEFFRDE